MSGQLARVPTAEEVVDLLAEVGDARIAKVWEYSTTITEDCNKVVRGVQKDAVRLGIKWDEWSQLTALDGYLTGDEECPYCYGESPSSDGRTPCGFCEKGQS